MHILGLITARAGSKRIINKNIKKLNNKPLISYTFDAAQKSKLLDKVILSTDGEKIASLAKNFNRIDVPFRRPEYLSRDDTKSYPVIKHAVKMYEKKFKKPDVIVLLQPTSPFRTHLHIDRSIRKFLNTKNDSLVSIRKIKFNNKLDYYMSSNKSQLSIVKNKNFRKNKPLHIYQRNGGIYIFTYKCLMFKKSIYGDKVLGYLMNANDSIDINNMKDWDRATKLLKKTSFL